MVNCIVIDDNPDIVNVFCDLLKIRGMDVVAIGNNGMQAVELYEKHHPDVIFVNLIMLRYDGFYAVKNIQNICQNAKIIVVTGDLTINESDLLDLYKITAVIFKPFDMNKVNQAVTDAFLEDLKLPKTNKHHI